MKWILLVLLVPAILCPAHGQLDGCDCGCECDDPPCGPTPGPTCTPSSVCEAFVDASSSFSQNCGPCMGQILLDDMYQDCLANEGDDAALQAFLDNIAALCEDQTGIEITFSDGGDCSTDPPIVIDYVVVCECSCICPVDPIFECTTTAEPTPDPTPDPTPVPTPCISGSVCDEFVDVNSDFFNDCAPCMNQILLNAMYEDCLDNEGDEAALQAFLDNIAALCEDQTGLEVTFETGGDCDTTPEPQTTPQPQTTVCVPTSVCEEFVTANSDFFQNCAPCMGDILLDDMYEDCLANEDDEAALQAFLDNIAALCEDQTGIEITYSDGC